MTDTPEPRPMTDPPRPHRPRDADYCSSCHQLWPCATFLAAIPAPAVEPDGLRDEDVARLFHEAYERLAPSFGYETRKASAVPWESVPEPNRSLMVAVAADILADYRLVPVAEMERLRALSAAATPGSWFVDDSEEVSSEHGDALRENPWRVISDHEGLLPAVELADAAFIVAAVAYVRSKLASHPEPRAGE